MGDRIQSLAPFQRRLSEMNPEPTGTCGRDSLGRLSIVGTVPWVSALPAV